MSESFDTKQLFDHVNAGFMYIDCEGSIRLFNHSAKNIIGIIHGTDFNHPAGQLLEGDIVLMADNSLGGDDGGLDATILKSIGIRDKTIEKGNSLVAIGTYLSKSSKPVYKVFRGPLPSGKIYVEQKIEGRNLKAAIDFGERLLSIEVGDQVFDLNYLISMGHLVILDRKTMQVKFIQAKGYSYRNETIREILTGQPFLAKGAEEVTRPDPIGQTAETFFGSGEFIDDLNTILTGKSDLIKEKHYFLQGRQLLCTLRAVKDPINCTGVSVNLLDVSELGDLLKMREDLIETIERSMTTIVPHHFGDLDTIPNIQGNSLSMQEVKYFIKKAAQIKSTVFITGENGTGKTMVAREIHNAQHPEEPFIEVNCGSIPQSLFESELFGYTPGSFTGALKQGKEGFFQLAGNGTIFLDEITEIPPSIQGKLLHVLQDKRYYPIGASKPITISARIIAATNRKITEEISLNRFREDLYYRLNVFPINIPPLRKRTEDIYALSQAIMKRLQKEYGLSDKILSGGAYQQILNHPWPGNVRELENVLERAMLICEGSTIYPEHLNLEETRQSLHLQEVREAAEKHAIQTALLHTKDRRRLMELLGVSKSTLYEKLKQYNLSG
ncbi:MAG TPA: sigma-54-dependent Fis family transcriptional regulator [Tissierellia bacterium]|nr:sigma-54-dependent Fis family transcriptional regulator [Tissierellia bacterium]